MKFSLCFGSKTDKLVIPSPIKDKPFAGGEAPIGGNGLKPQFSPAYPAKTFSEFGSKEETFFDTRAWLDSDCEDDFFSVNGDFTPSRGNTPLHHNFAAGTPRVNKALFDNQAPASELELSPTTKKKRLSDLFKESERENLDLDEQNASGNLNASAYVSGVTSVCSSERTPNGNFKLERETSVRSVHCCLPSFVRSSRSSLSRKEEEDEPCP